MNRVYEIWWLGSEKFPEATHVSTTKYAVDESTRDAIQVEVARDLGASPKNIEMRPVLSDQRSQA